VQARIHGGWEEAPPIDENNDDMNKQEHICTARVASVCSPTGADTYPKSRTDRDYRRLPARGMRPRGRCLLLRAVPRQPGGLRLAVGAPDFSPGAFSDGS